MLINRNKPRKIIINGNELLHKMDGMTRVAIEMVRRLDRMLDPGEALLVVRDKDALASVIELKYKGC